MLILASSSDDQTRNYGMEHVECLRTLQGHTSWICSVAFSPEVLPLLVAVSIEQ